MAIAWRELSCRTSARSALIAATTYTLALLPELAPLNPESSTLE
jgi:hypothetical protein